MIMPYRVEKRVYKWLVPLVIVFLFLVPFFINLRFLMPRIESLIEERLNVDIEFDALYLTLFSGLGLKLENVRVKNKDKFFTNTDLIRAEEIHFAINLLPLLTGKINATLSLDKPFFELVRKNNKDNFSNLLIKDTNQQVKNVKVKTHNKEAKNELALESPWLARLSVSSIDIKNGSLTYFNYKDSSDLKESYRFSNVDLEISDLGLNKETRMIIKNYFNMQDSESLVQGPISIEMILKHNTKEGIWQSSNFKGSLKLDQLSFQVSNIFTKSKKDPLGLGFQGYINKDKISVDELVLENDSLKANALLDFNYKSPKKNILIKLKTKCSHLSKLLLLTPSYKNLIKSGHFNLNLTTTIPINDLHKTKFSLSSKGLVNNSDFSLKTQVQSIFPLKGYLNIQSLRFDIDEIIASFRKDEVNSSQSKRSGQEKSQSKKMSSKEDLTETVSKKLLNANFKIDLKMNTIHVNNMTFKKFLFNGNLLPNRVESSNFTVHALGGKMSSQNTIDLTQKELNGHFSASHVTLKKLAEKFDNVLAKSFESDVSIDTLFKSSLNFDLDSMHSKGQLTFHKGFIYTKYLLEFIQNSFKNYIENLNSETILSKIEKKSTTLKSFIESIDKKENLVKSLDKLIKSLSKLDPKFTTSSNLNIKPTLVDYHMENSNLDLKTTLNEDYVHMSPHLQIGLGPKKDLKGHIFCQTTEKFRHKLLEQNKDAELFFDSSKKIQFNIDIEGSLNRPKVSLDLKSLNTSLFNNFKKNQLSKMKSKPKELLKDPKKLKNKLKGLLDGLLN